MNVKPGDLAEVFRVNDQELACNIGRIVEVLAFAGTVGGDVVWEVQCPSPGWYSFLGSPVLFPSAPGEVVTCHDNCLRRIGGVDPGEDVPEGEPVFVEIEHGHR